MDGGGVAGVLLHTVTEYQSPLKKSLCILQLRKQESYDEGRMADYPSLASAETAFISR